MTSSSVELVIPGLSWTEGRRLWLAPAATPGRRGALGPVQPSGSPERRPPSMKGLRQTQREAGRFGVTVLGS